MITPYSPKKSVFYVILFDVLGKPLGLLTTVLIAYYFGTGRHFDAFVWCSSFLLLCVGMIVGMWPLVITPVLTKIDAINTDEAWGYISAVLSYGTLFILAIGGFIYFFSGAIVRSFTNFEPETQEITVNILRNMVPFFIFNGIYQIEKTVLNSYRNFKITSITGFLSKILLLGSLLLFTNYFYISSLVIGNILLAFFQFLVPLYVILKIKNVFSFKICCDFKWIKKSLIMVIPFYVAQTINTFIELFYRYIASGLEEGSLSYLSYGMRIKDLAISTLAVSVSAVAFTEFSKSYSERNLTVFEKNFYKSIFTVWYLIIPTSAFLFFFGDSLIVLLFKRGSFDDESAVNSYKILQVLSIGLFAWSGHYFTHRAFYSFHDTITSMFVSIPNAFVIVALYYFFAKWLSVQGIAIAFTIAAIWCFWLYLFIFSCKHMKIDLKRFLKKLAAFTILSLLCFGIFKYSVISYFVPFQENIFTLFIKTSAAFLVPMLFYVGITYWIKNPEAMILFDCLSKATHQIKDKVRSYKR